MFGLVMLMLSAAVAFFLGYRVARDWSRNARMIGVMLAIVVGFCFFRFAYDSIRIIALFPSGLLPFAAEWQVPFVAVGAGIFLREVTLPRWRRGVLSLTLVVVSLLPVVRMVAATAPRSDNVWSGPVCRQTNSSTCSAAAAATLLRYHGIKATEAEMIDLCFTRRDGTSLGGLARGLRNKAPDKTVKMASLKLEDLKRESQHPAILIVGLTPEVAERDPRYEEQWGWAVGLRHAVVCFGFTKDGNPIIGDPSVGREVWSEKGLSDLWTGAAVWLE